MEEVEKHFGPLDLAIFIGFLLASAATGSYFAYKDRKNTSSDNYYFGGRTMSPVLVAMSMAVSVVSAMTIIGMPVEVYFYGTVILWVLPATIFATVITVVYYIPLIYRLKLSSIYEYLERRFSKTVRKLCSGFNIIGILINIGIIVYLPALALNAVTPLSVNWAIFLTSSICTFYTSVGGMKAVIWTDMLQGLIMTLGSVAILVKAVITVGGFADVIAAVERGERNNFLKPDIDPRVRSTPLSIFIGMFINACVDSCCSQIYSQRYLCCKSVKDARIATSLRVLPIGIFMLLAASNGLAMYAYYEGCDPIEFGTVSKQDQTVPRMVIEIFHDVPGMAGIFISAAYSGTLSTVSSGINSLSAMTMEDFITPQMPDIAARRSNLLSKGLSVLYGCIVMGIAFLTSLLNSTVIQMSMAIAGLIGGPILSAYTMGIFVPWTNTKGAMSGLLLGWILTGWLSMSAIIYGPSPRFQEALPVSTEACNFTVSHSINATDVPPDAELASGTTMEAEVVDRPEIADTFYSLSPFLYGIFGFCTSCITAMVISLITGKNNPKNLDPELFQPFLSNKILPKSLIKFFRCGVPNIDEELMNEDKKNGISLLEDAGDNVQLKRLRNVSESSSDVWKPK